MILSVLSRAPRSTRMLRLAVTGALTAFAAMLLPATASATPQPVTSFSFSGEPGEPLTNGTSGVLREPAATFHLLQDRDITRISVDSSSDRWSIGLAPPSGERLRPGVYTGVERAGSQHGRAAGLDVDHRFTGCNEVFGRVTINQVAYDASGSVTMLDVSFAHHCEAESSPALKGTIRYRALPLSFHFQSDPGDVAGSGRTKTFTGATSLFFLNPAGLGLRFIASGQREDWSVDIAPPPGEQLHVGIYQDTRLPGSQEPGHPGLSAEGVLCASATGTFTIHELEFDSSGTPTALSLTFTQFCNENTAALNGTVHYFA